MKDEKNTPPVDGFGKFEDKKIFTKKRAIRVKTSGRDKKKIVSESIFGISGFVFRIAYSAFVESDREFEIKDQLIAIVLLVLCISSIILFFIVPIKSKTLPVKEKIIQANVFSCFSAVKPFRDYYGYTEPNVVTKCFFSSDGKFINQDVCLFTGEDGSLRIAADLRHGFLSARCDLGCYVFGKDEYECISAEKSEYNIVDGGTESRCVLLRSKDVYFLLGKRAYRFLREKKVPRGSGKFTE